MKQIEHMSQNKRPQKEGAILESWGKNQIELAAIENIKFKIKPKMILKYINYI